MAKVLITGLSGMVGAHLAKYLLSIEQEVHGTVRWRSNLENIVEIKNDLTLHYCELKDKKNVDDIVEKVKPDFIFHLASQSIVWASFEAPKDTLDNNIGSTANLLEAVRKFCPQAVVHVAGSSEQYGLVKEDECPVNENNSFRPMSPYAISKVACELLAIQYYKSYGLKTVITRAFNHSGKFRPTHFAESSFAKQVAERKLGLTIAPIEVGNLEARRDYTHVEDMVRAYWLAVNRCEYGEPYVVASGKAYSMYEILDILMEIADIKCDVVVDEKRLRPSDVPLLIGNSTKFRDTTGWKLEKDIKDILGDLFVWWIEKLEKDTIVNFQLKGT